MVQHLAEFAREYKQPQDLPDDRRVLKIEQARVDGLAFSAVLRTGHYGVACPMVNRVTGAPVYQRKQDDAELIPLHGLIDCGPAIPGPIAVFHRFGQLGARTSFEQAFNAYLLQQSVEYRISLNPIAPGAVLQRWLRQGQIAKISLHKRMEGKDALGELELLGAAMKSKNDTRKPRKPPPASIDVTLNIEAKWGHWKLSSALRSLLTADKVDPQAIAEFADQGWFKPTDVDITLDTEHRQRKFRVGSEFRISEDITDRVPAAGRDGERSDAIFKEARAYAASLLRDA